MIQDAATQTQAQGLTATNLVDLADTQIQAFATTSLRALSTVNFASLDETQLAALSTTQVTSLTNSQLNALNTTKIGALLDTQVAMTANMAMNFLASGKAPVRAGNAHPNIVPYQTFAAADGHIIVAVGNDAQFRKFCEIADAPELASDERFSTNPARVNNREVLVPILARLVATRSMHYWSEALEVAGVPCGPINDLSAVFEDPQVRHRGMRIELPHPAAKSVPLVASPMKLSRTPVEYRSAPPVLGEHTEEVLANTLGLSAEQISALRAAGVV